MLVAPLGLQDGELPPCRLFTFDYSTRSQLPSVSGGRLLQPQPEDAAYRGDKGPTSHSVYRSLYNINYINCFYKINHINNWPIRCETWSFHGDEDSSCGVLGFDTVEWCVRTLTASMFTLKIEATRSSEMLASYHFTTLENHDLQLVSSFELQAVATNEQTNT
jgi:hypothetical protein